MVVLGNEYLTRTWLLAGDSPQGWVFPALFSIGVIMVTADFANIHLDTHAVLVGDPESGVIQQLTIEAPGTRSNLDLGPALPVRDARRAAGQRGFPRRVLSAAETHDLRPAVRPDPRHPLRALNTGFMFLVSITVTAATQRSRCHPRDRPDRGARPDRLPAHRSTASDDRPDRGNRRSGAVGGFWAAYAANAATSAGMSVFYGTMFLLVLAANRAVKSASRQAALHRSTESEHVAPKTMSSITTKRQASLNVAS